MFRPIALHDGLECHILRPCNSGLKYIAGHPGNFGPSIKSMNTDIETEDYFVREVISNYLNLLELSRAAWRIDGHQHVSRLESGRVVNIFSSIVDLLPIESECSNRCNCGEDTSSYRAPALQPISQRGVAHAAILTHRTTAHHLSERTLISELHSRNSLSEKRRISQLEETEGTTTAPKSPSESALTALIVGCKHPTFMIRPLTIDANKAA
jgi:hypothetical protein